VALERRIGPSSPFRGTAGSPETRTKTTEMDQTEKDGLAGRATRVADLAGYQEGSVVSRTLVDKKAGTVTLFAFARGQGLSEHTAPYDAMVYVLDGEAEITISGRPVRVTQGEMAIMPASEPHSVRAITSFKMLLTMIRS